MKPMGATRWAIAEGYIPGWSHGPEPQFTSHETVCILKTHPTTTLTSALRFSILIVDPPGRTE